MNVTQEIFQKIVEGKLKQHERQGYHYEREWIKGTVQYRVKRNAAEMGQILIGADKGIAFYADDDEVKPIFQQIRDMILLSKSYSGKPPITDNGQQARTRIPKKGGAHYRRWQKIWKEAKPHYMQRESDEEIHERLMDKACDEKPAPSLQTLHDIIAAGREGLLDD